MEQWTREQFYAALQKRNDWGEQDRTDAVAFFDRTKERGDVVLVFENAHLSHPQVGDLRIVSYGSQDSFLTEEQFPTPPATLPDTTRDINWRYTLKARVS